MNEFNDDGELYGHLERATAELIKSGVPLDNAIRSITESVHDVLYDHGDRIAEDLIAESDRILASGRQNEQIFQRRLREIWGEAFDLMYLVGYGTAECADQFIQRHHESCARDDVFHALVRLHERSRRVFWEVYRLLTGGFPGGARARARTLYELAVVAIVIAEYGRQSTTSDIATRYLDHTVVGELAILEFEVGLEEERGYEISRDLTEKVEQLQVVVDQVKQRHGDHYEKSTGWAIPLLTLLPSERRQHKKVPSIADLEFLAGKSHMRALYGLMSAEIHAGADGLVHNLDQCGDVVSPLGPMSVIGPGLVDLAEPGRQASWFLHLSTWVLITEATGQEQIPIADLVALRSLEVMIRRYIEAGDQAEEAAFVRAERVSEQDPE